MDTSTLFRTFTPPDISVRSGGDGRTIHGIAVPWDYPVRVDERLNEEFAPGTFNHQIPVVRAGRVGFEREHVQLGGTLIGPVREIKNDAAGLYFEARASHTPAGDETLELVRDGALRDISVGFRERRNGQVMRNDPKFGDVTRRTKADLIGIAVVRSGAYGAGAQITGTRAAVDDDEVEDETGSRTYIDLGSGRTPNYATVDLPTPLDADALLARVYAL